MPTVYIRAVQGKGLISKLIQWRTDCKVDHVEFCWPLGSEPNPESRWLGAQPADGIQIRNSDYIKKARFYFFAIHVSETELGEMIDYALSKIGEPYDFLAIFNAAFNASLKLASRNHRADCSEFVYRTCLHSQVNLFNDTVDIFTNSVTPRDVIASYLLVNERP